MTSLLRRDLHLSIDGVVAEYRREGVARLGRVLSEEALSRLRKTVDDLMLGRLVRPGLFFQHDSATGRYEDLTRREGFTGPSLGYRKIEKLERDPTCLALIQNPLFEAIARRVLSPPISLYRAVLFNKAPRTGSNIPWHQDGGSFWGLTVEPELQIWVALDAMGGAQGPVEYLPGTHRAGLATPLGGVIPDNLTEPQKSAPRRLEVLAGEAVLIHNHVWHRSLANLSPDRRRAITVCYLSGATSCTRTKRPKRQFVRLFE